jgi:hypothetical protein
LIESFAAYADDILVLDTKGQPEYFGPPSGYSRLNFDLDNENPESMSYSPISDSSTAQDNVTTPEGSKSNSKVENNPDVKRQTGDITTWLYYARAVGIWPLMLLAFFIVVTSLGVNFPKLLLKWATEESFSVGKFIGLFAMITIITWVCQNAMVA